MRWDWNCIAGVLLAGAVAAQGDVGDQLQRLTQRLTELRAQESDLLEAAQVHESGGSLDESRWLAVTDVDRARASSPGAEALAAGMRDRTVALRSELAELAARAAAAEARARTEAEGDTLPRPEELARLAGAPVTDSVSDGAAAAVVVAARRPAAGAEPVVIRGSRDRLRVGRAFVEAGIGSLREAATLEREGRTELAEARRGAGRVRLEAARAELEPLARGPNASPAALFELARCEEALGRTAVADALYAAVMERDRQPDPTGRVEYGAFGRAARTARAVMGWLSDTSDWRPRRDVDRIRWDDR